jgi:5-formaminoimidazole-4-carboxamide-1-beta-D-ribofuranosyl 5'-monophosphate synthetase
MKRLFYFLFSSFFSFQAVGQQGYCLADTTSTSGQIIQRIQSDGFASVTITNKNTGKKYQGYRICEHHYVQVDSLNQLLTNSQIDTLLSCNNGALKTVGFILYSKRHNDKESVIKKLKEILSQEYIVMTSSCSDAIQFSSLGKLNYDLLTKANLFLNPNFKLTKEDKALLELDLAYYELQMKSN